MQINRQEAGSIIRVEGDVTILNGYDSARDLRVARLLSTQNEKSRYHRAQLLGVAVAAATVAVGALIGSALHVTILSNEHSPSAAAARPQAAGMTSCVSASAHPCR